MARPRTPTRLKVLNGSAQHDPGRLPKREPKPTGRPIMPADMGDEAKRVWRRVWREFGATGVLKAVDGFALRILCEAMARHNQAAKMLQQSGPVVRDAHHGGQLIKNPLHQIVRDNAAIVRTFARELGLTPSARAGLEVATPDEDDPTAAWLRERDEP